MDSETHLRELEDRVDYVKGNPVSGGRKMARVQAQALLTAATALVEIRQDLRQALDLEDNDAE